jgi:cold shock CspA family protein
MSAGIGWAWIRPDNAAADAKDIFCHGVALKRAGIPDIAVGDRLSFDIVESRNRPGKFEADVRRKSRHPRVFSNPPCTMYPGHGMAAKQATEKFHEVVEKGS